jgi:hypothetical protein
MTVFSFNALRRLRGHYMRNLRRRVVPGANTTAKPRRHHHAEHVATRQMRY